MDFGVVLFFLDFSPPGTNLSWPVALIEADLTSGNATSLCQRDPYRSRFYANGLGLCCGARPSQDRYHSYPYVGKTHVLRLSLRGGQGTNVRLRGDKIGKIDL